MVVSYIMDMLPYMALSLPPILAARHAAVRGMRKRGADTTRAHELGTVLFFLFLVGLASQTVIPKLEFGAGGIGIVRERAEGGINLELGRVFRDTRWEFSVNDNPAYLLINFIGNICIFVPVGFGVPLLWRGGALWKSALIGLGISVLIELCQLPQARGTDIDDLWLNTLGAVIGYGLYALLGLWLGGVFDRFKVRKQTGGGK